MDFLGTIFNERMRQLSDERNLSVAEMARMVGIPATTMATYLKNREPKFEILVKMSEVFEVNLLWLIGQSEDREFGQSKAHEQQKKKKYRVTFEISVEEIE